VAACDELVSGGFARPTISTPDGAYRTFAQQQYWATYWAAAGKPDNASTPGFSNHGWGTCVDISDATQYPQDTLRSVMARHGFAHDYTPEAWHFHHTSTNPADTGHTLIAAATPVSTPTAPKHNGDRSMILVRASETGQANFGSIALITETSGPTVFGSADIGRAVAYAKMCNPNGFDPANWWIPLSSAEFIVMVADCTGRKK
jgi:hypothetical protein